MSSGVSSLEKQGKNVPYDLLRFLRSGFRRPGVASRFHARGRGFHARGWWRVSMVGGGGEPCPRSSPSSAARAVGGRARRALPAVGMRPRPRAPWGAPRPRGVCCALAISAQGRQCRTGGKRKPCTIHTSHGSAILSRPPASASPSRPLFGSGTTPVRPDIQSFSCPYAGPTRPRRLSRPRECGRACSGRARIPRQP